MDAPSGLIRPLGPCEIYSSSRHALGFYKCVANTCRYVVPLERLQGRTIRSLWENAVANVVHAVPSLSVGILGQDTSSPLFVQPPSIDMEDHFQYLELAHADRSDRDSTLLAMLEDQHDRSWPDIERRPPWKLAVVVWDPAPHDGQLVLDAIFAVHHAIADGRSTALFHSMLLEELNRQWDQPQPPPPSGRVLTPARTGAGRFARPQEELVKFSRSWGFLVATLWQELVPAWLKWRKPVTPWAGKNITREPCRTRLRLVTIPAISMPRVIAACRANNVTLTALLHALVLGSLARRVPAEAARAFRASTPIDLRPFIESRPAGDGSLFGVLVTGHFQLFDSPDLAALRTGPLEDEIWRTAAGWRRSMKERLQRVPADDIMSMLGWVGDWQKYWLSKVGKPRQDTWEVSNLGSMPGGRFEDEEAAGSWTIQRSIMSQGATVAGAAIGISVAGVTEGETSIALGWQEEIVETEIINGLVEDLQGWLAGLGEGRGFSP